MRAGLRVIHEGHPEYGLGVIKLIDENLLDDERTCQVAFDWRPGLTAVPEHALVPAVDVSGSGTIGKEEWGDAEDLRCRLGAVIAMAENSRTGAFMRSFVTPLPHQTFLLEKVVCQNRFGHIIADDVGMGKTIEAGLIIATLRQQDPRARILILCPAGLVLQWQDEMDEHFGLEFGIVGRDFNPKVMSNWKNHALILACLDTLKQETFKDLLKQVPPFDLIICDEAHRLTAKRDFMSNELYRTLGYRFVEWLAGENVVDWVMKEDGSPRSPRLLLLSGTPHQGDDLRFAYLLQLVRPDRIVAEEVAESGGIPEESGLLEECITRTAKKRAVDWCGNPIFKGHDSRTLDVGLQDDEIKVLAMLTRYVLDSMHFADGGNPLVRALSLHTFQKIAASSWAALESALERRLAGDVLDAALEQFEDAVSMDGCSPPDERDKTALCALIDGLSNLQTNSKWERFEELMSPGNGFREGGDRVLVFTQYRITQQWLHDALTKRGEKVALIHGGLGIDERRCQRTFFETDGTVLISTEAGSEGANLHRKCHLVINFDLPWNPMRLLQRIGRLDRYGQKHRVKVANLRAPQSWDREISDRIALRLDCVQSSMGQVAEEDYRSMILGEVHEAINVPETMISSNWGDDPGVIDSAVNDAIQKVLSRKQAMDRLFRESLGMPEGREKEAAALSSDDFRQAFAWAASRHGIALRETRTSDNRYLKGVHHFTLPEAFRGGFRPSREVYLVFDRDIFADVRGEVLGQARGQEIKPNLAGMGDPVTDWFFRGALQAGPRLSAFAMGAGATLPKNEAWWIVYAGRWKNGGDWAGPDACFVLALDCHGTVLRRVNTNDVFGVLKTAVRADTGSVESPPLDASLASAKSLLKSMLPDGFQAQNLALFPLSVIRWVG